MNFRALSFFSCILIFFHAPGRLAARAMPSFSPSGYLSSQGWSGPGSGLQPGSRAKPITVIKRKDLQGLGKERDESFAWWDDVFKTVAGKVGKTSNAEGSVRSVGSQDDAGADAVFLVRLASREPRRASSLLFRLRSPRPRSTSTPSPRLSKAP